MGGWGKEKSTFLPNLTRFPHEPAPVNACIVKNHKRIFTDTERKSVKKVGDFVYGHILGGRETFILVACGVTVG